METIEIEFGKNPLKRIKKKDTKKEITVISKTGLTDFNNACNDMINQGWKISLYISTVCVSVNGDIRYSVLFYRIVKI